MLQTNRAARRTRWRNTRVQLNYLATERSSEDVLIAYEVLVTRLFKRQRADEL